jgi:hypothetical protein
VLEFAYVLTLRGALARDVTVSEYTNCRSIRTTLLKRAPLTSIVFRERVLSRPFAARLLQLKE